MNVLDEMKKYKEVMNSEELFLETPSVNMNGIYACGLRKRGTAHIRNGKPCQDAILLSIISNNVSLYSTCDGHGNEKHKYSEDGARIGTEATVQAVKGIVNECKKDNLSDDETEEVLRKSNENYKLRCRIMDCWKSGVLDDYRHNKDANEELSEQEIYALYGTTLLYVIVTKNYYLVGQVGDGAILFYNNMNDFEVFDRSGIKESEATYSLCTELCEYRHFNTGTYIRKYFYGFMITTDGLYDRYESINKESQNMGIAVAYYTLATTLKVGGSEELYRILLDEDFYEGISDDCSVIVAIGTDDENIRGSYSCFMMRDRADVSQIDEHHINYLQSNLFQSGNIVQLGNKCLTEKSITSEMIPAALKEYFPESIMTETMRDTTIIRNMDDRICTFRSFQTMDMRGFFNIRESRKIIDILTENIKKVCDSLYILGYVPTADFIPSLLFNQCGEIMFLPTAFMIRPDNYEDLTDTEKFDLKLFFEKLHLGETIEKWMTLGIPVNR